MSESVVCGGILIRRPGPAAVHQAGGDQAREDAFDFFLPLSYLSGAVARV